MSAPVQRSESVVPVRLERLFAALTAAGVRWSVLRPPSTLSGSAGDVDLLVDPTNLERVRDVLVSEGFAIVRLDGSDVHASDLDEATGRFVWIHMQSELRLADEIIPAGSVLDQVVFDPVARPADDWLLWILLVRALIDKGGLAERHRSTVQALALAGVGPPAELQPLLTRHGLSTEVLLGLAAAGEWAQLDLHALRTVEPRRPRRPVSGVVRRLQRLRGGRGLSVAVLGPDGAGKTTLVDTLDRELPFETRRHYMGLTGGRIPRAEALRVPGVVLAARLTILWVRFARSEYDRRLGRIVLFDRYTLDGAVPSGVPLRPLARLSRRLQRRACPMPDLVLLLDASGATMHGRKGEYDPETLETWRAAYGRLVGKVAQLEVLDAEQSPDEVLRQAQASIWRRYRRRLEEERR